MNRKEEYRIRAGEAGSYLDYDGVGQGGNPGSQGFPGFQPSDVTDRSRDSWAGYVDVELDVTDRLLISAAARYEDYSDFGSTLNAKLTVGATNIFDVFPSSQDPNETDNGHIYESVQFGLNGRAYFTRFWYRF